ncbi:glycosyltransferase family 4 protein [Candidatus Peregrinibacteria bacterium]|nr:glycosyltransferase family 4 protein [Candidatus Peregrinibacteria bacterium]
MRIGIDARLYSSAFTGIGRYVYELINHVTKLDTKSEYVIFLNSPSFESFVPPRKGVEKILADAPHYSFKEQWNLCRALWKAKLDLMHFTHFNAPILYRKPSVVTIHDLTINLYPGRKFNNWRSRFGYHLTINSIVNRSRRVIAVSEHTKRDVVKFLKTDPAKIGVIHEGVNPQFHHIANTVIIENFRNKNGLTKPYILYTGVWRSHKNLVNLIKAFAVLKHKYKFEGWLVITGKEDPWYPEVKQTVAEERLEGEVRFTGLVPDEDLVLLYNAALLYVLPSFYEGFGLPALEAFACGIPVCAAQSSSLPEVCGEGNAVFFNPHDASDMAQKMASVYTDRAKREELVTRGYARLKDFSWDKMAIETLEIYKRALHKN